jgi:hypothetical protein
VQRAVDLLPNVPRRGQPTGEPVAAQAWGTFEDVIAKQAGPSRGTRFDFEAELVDALKANARTPLPTSRRIELALKLLAIIMVSWRLDEREADMFVYGLHHHGGESRMSLAWFARQLDERRGQPIGSVLRWLIERCVLDQLQRVGYSKGPGTSKLLLVREENAVLLVRPEAAVHPFAQDANRLGATLALLEGLSLTEWDGDQLVRSAAGDEFLAAVDRQDKRLRQSGSR